MSENITQTELKECIENTGKAFEEFKSTYNEKLTYRFVTRTRHRPDAGDQPALRRPHPGPPP